MACPCAATPWSCDLYFISTQDYTDYYSGSGYADCYMGGKYDCSVNVQDARYSKGDGRIELVVCTAKTCAKGGLGRGATIGIVVGSLWFFGVVTGVAVWWFIIRGAPIVVVPPGEEEEICDPDPQDADPDQSPPRRAGGPPHVIDDRLKRFSLKLTPTRGSVFECKISLGFTF
jgi:hypothetical protein